jgi:Tfp pilus assembly protein FimV
MLTFKRFTQVALVATSFCVLANVNAQAVKLGDAGVLSAQGQPLKVLVPYSGSAERVPLLRFTVEDVQVPAGFEAPSARSFTMMQGENNNQITVLSREKVDAPNVTMIVKVAGTAGEAKTYNLVVPAAQYASTDSKPVAAKKAMGKKKPKRSYKRKIVAQDNLPPK